MLITSESEKVKQSCDNQLSTLYQTALLQLISSKNKHFTWVHNENQRLNSPVLYKDI